MKSSHNAVPFVVAIAFIALVTASTILGGCGAPGQEMSNSPDMGAGYSTGLTDSGPAEVVVFFAGSLTVPMKRISEAFSAAYPGARVIGESSGSRLAARKITDLHRAADVILSADFEVIQSFLFPKHAGWSLSFAGNEMVIAWTQTSKFCSEITPANWFEILCRPGVKFGMSDPELDPAGYRTLMVWQLADLHYQDEARGSMTGKSISEELRRACPAENVRPSSVQLLPLLESMHLDYCFEYRSVAEQHNLPYLRLSPEINLSDQTFASQYAKAAVELQGVRPGEKIILRGTPIEYALTIPINSPHPIWARRFVDFIVNGKGSKIFTESDQPLTSLRFETIPRTGTSTGSTAGDTK